MEIYILRDGKETGPFDEVATQSMLEAGSLLIDDLAWTAGLANWTPLIQLLHPSATPEERTPPTGTKPPDEPATARQKAFLSYVGVTFPSDITRERAAILVSEAVENPKSSARVKQWDEDRLKLHPELFADELRAKKENRPAVFFDLCRKEGAERFAGVTKAHCQVLMNYLDVRFPNWDAYKSETATEYFFAAMAEKFPQVVRKPWRGKLKFPDGRRVAAELLNGAPVNNGRHARMRMGTLVRGLVIGLAILLIVYVGRELLWKGGELRRNIPAAIPAAPSLSAPAPQDNPPTLTTITTADVPVASTNVVTPASAPEMTASAPPVERIASANPPTPTLPFDLPPTPEPTDIANAPVDTATAVAARTIAAITKPTDVELRFGEAKLPVGTRLKIISQEGSLVRASHLGEEVLVPIENTDLLRSRETTAPL